MAVQRDRPYPASAFRVEIAGLELGCSEVELPELEETIAEYRTGDGRGTRLVPTGARFGELVLRRGFDGDLTLSAWWRSVADGTRDERTVVVTVLDELRQPVAQVRCLDALPAAYTLGPLDADASAGGVLVESLAARVADVVIE